MNGRSAGLARLGLPRRSAAKRGEGADAAICGFEYLVPGALLSEAGDDVTVEAVVSHMDGSTTEGHQVTIGIENPEPPFTDVDGRAGELRRRVRAIAHHSLVGERRPEPGHCRLLVFTHDLELGGAQLYLVELLRRLTQREDFSAVLVAPEDGPLRPTLEAAGVAVHVTTGYGYLGAESYEGKLAELAALARLQGANMVMVNTIAGFIGVDLAGRLGLPSVWKIHESLEVPSWSEEVHSWPVAHRYARERFREALVTASAVVFAAEATRRQYNLAAEPSRFLTLPYGIDHAMIDAHRSEAHASTVRRGLGLPENATVILSLGTLEKRKSQLTLAKAFSLMAEDHPEAVLCLVGSRGDDYAQAVEDYIVRAGLAERVRVRPLSHNAFDWLLAADLLVCASDIESLPFSILEAMAFETPILSTGIFGIPTVIEEGRTGYLCEPRDIASLADGLHRALTAGPATRARVARAAAERVRSDHRIDRYVEDFSSLLFSLLEGPDEAATTSVMDEPARRSTVSSPAATSGPPE